MRSVAKWQQDNPGRHRQHQEKYRNKLRVLIRELKDDPCTRCGGSFPVCAMQWHHTDGTTKRERTLMNSVKQARIHAAECRLVCANCHLIIHHGEHGE